MAWVWFRDTHATIKNAVLVLGTCRATPYLQDYDLVFAALAQMTGLAFGPLFILPAFAVAVQNSFGAAPVTASSSSSPLPSAQP